jgi:hypothetical protein
MFPIRKKFFCVWRDGEIWGDVFDYPKYGGLPKIVSSVLSPEAVDAMQYVLQSKFLRKRDFARAYRNHLRDLGERGKY